jgi:hypothetical protein
MVNGKQTLWLEEQEITALHFLSFCTPQLGTVYTDFLPVSVALT